MSATVFKKFVACQAEALAEIKGEWTPNRDQTPLLVGNYLHSYFESEEAHERFLDKHADQVFRNKERTKQYKVYDDADKMIHTLASDRKFQDLYQGEKESIVTGRIAGVPWMGKLDCLNLENGYFVDLKTTRELDNRYWDSRERRWVPFVLAYDYQLQMVVYRELVKQQYGIECVPLIVAITKQDPPDKAVITIPDDYMEDAMWRIKDQLPHFESVINGDENPVPCGKCDYCRGHKQLDDIISVDDLLDD